MKWTPKKQLGGFTLPTSVQNLFQGLENPDFGNILSQGHMAGAPGLGNAFINDDPNKINEAVLRLFAQQQAQTAPGVESPEEIEEHAKRRTFLGIGKRRVKRELEAANQERIEYEAETQIPQDLSAQAASLNSILSLFGNLSFEKGGSLDRTIQALGYSDGSPFRSLAAIDIDSGKIDMSKTGQAILAIPDVGNPKVLAPYSGLHTFRKATKVTEIPLQEVPEGKLGGKMKRKKKKKYFYQQGGEGTVPIGVQLEEGEMFATPQLDLMETSATEKHEDMKSGEVTDVIRGGDYVLSDRPGMKVTLKEAEDMSFGYGPMYYEEGKKPEKPEEQLMSKLFKKGEKSLTFAEYARRVKETYPTNNREDVFSKKTSDTNKANRLPYISALAFLNEKKRTKGKEPMSGFAADFENLFEVGDIALAGEQNPANAYAVKGLNPNEVPEAQLGGIISGVAGLVQGVSNLFASGAARRRTRKAYSADRADIQRLAQTQSQYAGLATGIGAAGIIGQDPTVNAPQYSTSELDASIRRVPRSYFDYQAGRLAAANQPYLNALFANTGSFSEAVNAFSPVQANTIGAMAGMGANEIQQNIGLENQYRGSKQRISEAQTLADTNAGNLTRQNVNQLFAGLAGQLQSGVGAQGQIQSDRINALRGNRLNETGSLNQIGQNTANAVGQIGVGLGLTGMEIFKPRTVPTTTPPPVTTQTPSATVGSYAPPSGFPASAQGISGPGVWTNPNGQTMQWDPGQQQWIQPSSGIGPSVPQIAWDPVTQQFYYK